MATDIVYAGAIHPPVIDRVTELQIAGIGFGIVVALIALAARSSHFVTQ